MEKNLEMVSESFNSLIKLFKQTVENAESQKKNKVLSSSIINLALLFIKTEVDEEFIEKFLAQSRPMWPSMVEKSLDKFKESVNIIFPSIPNHFIDEFKIYFEDDTIVSEQMKEVLWSKVHKLCIGSISYCHHRRNPDPETKRYRDTFAPTIKVKEGIEMFKITSL